MIAVSYHWAEISILEQSPGPSYILSRRLGGSPPRSGSGTYLSSPGSRRRQLRAGPRRPLSPSAGAAARAFSRNAREHRRLVGRAPRHRQPHRRRGVVQRPVGHAVAHQRAHGLRHERDARRPPRRGRSRSASRPLPARSAPHRRVGRSRSPAPRAGPGEPAGVSRTSDSPTRSQSRTSERWRERVDVRHRDHHLLLEHGLEAQPGPAAGRAQEADVEAAVVELAQLLGRAELVQAQRDVRRLLAERAQQLGHEAVHRGADEADREPADLAALHPPRLARRVLDRRRGSRARARGTPRRPRSARPCAGCAAAACAPTSSSSWRICWLSGGWDMCRRSAARRKCSSSATATK